MTASVARIPTQEPPHSVDAEQALIGAVMLDPKAWAKVSNRVSAADFYRADHRGLWHAISTLVGEGFIADSVALVDRLERSRQLEDCGGREYAANLMASSPGASNVETYARIVREHSVKRRLGDTGRAVAKLERADTSADEALQEAARIFGELYGTARIGRGLVEARQLVGELLDDLDRRQAGEHGLSVGLADFDRLSYGLDPGDLVVIAARPGMGKTALLVSIAATVSEHAGVAVFSAEMPASQLMRRCIATVGGLPQSKLRNVESMESSDWETVAKTTAALSTRRLWVDDTAAPTLDHVRGEVLALQTRAPLGLVMVDYVQLVQGEGANRYEQLRDVSYGLKALAKEARIPIVLLAQLNRGVDNRQGSKRPKLADLRDSGAIEEAADIVGLLYSESYYDPEFSMPYVLECAIEKNRNGERGQCLWRFAGDLSRVTTLDQGALSHYRHLLNERRNHGKGDDL